MAKFLNNKLIISLFTSLMLFSAVSCKSLAMERDPKNNIAPKESQNSIEAPKMSCALTEEDLEGIMKNVDFFSDVVKSTGLNGDDVDKFYDDQENKQINQKK